MRDEFLHAALAALARGVDMRPPRHLLEVCKIGHGHECCRYVLMGADGWLCGKVDPKAKVLLDDPIRRARFVAQGDNCDGVQNLNDMPRDV